MKNLIILFAIFAGSLLCNNASAQVRIKLNIASQPIWGPVGYDHVDYYYLPDIEMYYDVSRHRYIYNEGGHWRSRSNLPARYRNYDMYNARKVVMNEPKPYLHHQEYKTRYATDDHSKQQSIRDSHDSKYFVNKHHPEHDKWRRN